jgi:hypothetical protein
MSATTNRSSFVTVLAWIFIVLSGFTTAISILQNIMVWTMFRQPEIANAMANPPPGAPPFMAAMLGYFPWFFLAFLLVSATTLASSIGLLKRMNWARVVFIVLMFLGIAWNLLGLFGQFAMAKFVQAQFTAMPKSPDMPDFQVFMNAIMVVNAIFAVGFSVLFGWIAKRLASREIRAEFGVPA